MCPNVPKSIIEEGVELRVVPQKEFPNQFYVSYDGKIGLKVFPNGRKSRFVPNYNSSPNQKSLKDAHRKQRYTQFKDAFSHHRGIRTSRAVYRAWKEEIPIGYQIDHLNGIVADNRADNLDAVTPSENHRRIKYQHFLKKHCPLHAQTFTRQDYLRFFAMPFDEFKELILHDFGKPANPEARMEKELTRHQEC